MHYNLVRFISEICYVFLSKCLLENTMCTNQRLPKYKITFLKMIETIYLNFMMK